MYNDVSVEIAIKGCEKSGWLMRQNNSTTGLRKYFCILSWQVLYDFDDEKVFI